MTRTASTFAGPPSLTWRMLEERDPPASDGVNRRELVVTANETATVLDDGRVRLLIDYAEHRLYRLESPEDCRLFSLLPGKDPGELLAGTIELHPSGEELSLEGMICRRIVLRFGGIARLGGHLAPMGVQRYGEKFSEGQGECWVTEQVTHLETLYALAARRSPLFRAIPLLRRLDPLGVVTLSGGFPVRCTLRQSGETITQTLLATPVPISGEDPFRLPAACLSPGTGE